MIICFAIVTEALRRRWWEIRQANSVCSPSSRAINSFEKHSPGIMPFCFTQKIAAKEVEKNIPSTAAKAIILEENGSSLLSIHFKHHSAFALTDGIVIAALKRRCCSAGSFIRVEMSVEYNSAWIFSLFDVSPTSRWSSSGKVLWALVLPKIAWD